LEIFRALSKVSLALTSAQSQNHKIVEVARHLWRSATSTPAQSRVTETRLTMNIFNWVLNTFRDADSTNLFGNQKKKGIVFKWNFLYFSLCPLPLILSLNTTERCLALSSSLPPSGIYGEDLSEPSLLHVKQSHLF